MKRGFLAIGIEADGTVFRRALFYFQAEDGILDLTVTGVQTCALPILSEAVVLAAELVHPVLGDRALAFRYLQPDIGVLAEALGAGIGADEIEDGVADLRDDIEDRKSVV